MSQIDALIVTALKEEHDAARAVASASEFVEVGVGTWEERDAGSYTEHLVGRYRTEGGQALLIALARPTSTLSRQK